MSGANGVQSATISRPRNRTSRAVPEAEGLDLASTYKDDHAWLVRFFRRRGIPHHESDDLAQETVLRALIHLKRHGRRREDLGPLMRTIARNLLIERVRRSAPATVSWSDGFDLVDSSDNPEEAAVASERQAAVRGAVRSLHPRHRKAVDLWMGGQTPAEIARELGIKRNAADAILHRARRSLAAKLDGRMAGALVPAFFVRLRAQARRVTDAATSLDPSGAVAQAAGGFAMAGTLVLVSLSGSGSADSAERQFPVPPPAPAFETDAIEPAQAGSTETADVPNDPAPVPEAGEGGSPVVIDIPNHSGSAEVAGFTDRYGQYRSLSVGWEVERDSSGQRGVTEHVLDGLATTTCSSLTSLCEGLANP